MCSKIILVLMVIFIVTTGGETCHPNDLKALTDFKAGIRYDTSFRLEKWNGSTDCCKWEGILCDNSTGRVIELNLPGLLTLYDAPAQTVMDGQLSPSIALLSSLEVLDLGEVLELKGQIPPLIGNLTKLRKLLLDTNKLSGPIPDSIDLESLTLQENFLTGHIPNNIGNLRALKELDLSNNFLTGGIPFSMNKLNSISSIFLGNNQLEGEIPFPSSPGQMSSLAFLRLNDNHLTGRLPLFFGHLKSLQRVILDNNQIEGPIHSNFSDLKALTMLYLSRNRFSGKLPRTIGLLSQLQFLDLSYNMIQGPLPLEMSTLTNLQLLDLSFNHLNLSSIPTWLVELPSLFQLHLAGCGIQGEIPGYLERPASILQELDLSDNHITGSIPAWIGSFTSLYLLNLSQNSLASKIPDTVTKLGRLGVLDLHSNRLWGPLNLVFQMQSSGGLTYIDLSDNSFSNDIEQADMGTQQGIQYLNLSHNFLHGKVPTSVGKLQSLQTLDLSYNRFDSVLPESLANASILVSLELQNNLFTGRIPDGFLKLTKLKELNLSDNLLSGQIPIGEPLINFPKSSYSGNRGLCGKPLATCSPHTVYPYIT
ncbi:probable leucine-rich repeat receptor-like protein kinase At5g63930 isoform X2 [Coffea eugenioides]|uniref:probable leucine-rich repeat receptor-like protein kinase At5g63930 isoform X2 n=1 Tax=Coffea eugenioides TaxID=49369 RepID=UPI000F6085EF|nr:probable leucine-rich repeat receptor-like protein kinase At5g63930 isoform X2 [Coffea eugenioides]